MEKEGKISGGDISKGLSLLAIVISTGLLLGFERGYSSLVPCTSPSDYNYGQILSYSSLQTVKTDSWFTVSVTTKNTGNCKTLYRAYAEIPTDLFPKWSFPDYFWLEPGESTTVNMRLWTGGITGSGVMKVILESHYTLLTTIVDTRTMPITITNESIPIEDQIEQTKDALESELNEALSRANSDFQRSPISKLGNVHFALHIVGENAADEDMRCAVEAQKHEIEISENAADAVAIAVGHAFTPAAGAGQAVVQAVCAFSHFEGTPLESIRNGITQTLLKNDIVSDGYEGEKKNSYVTVYLGGPKANKKTIAVNARMKELNLPYFDGNDLVTPDGKVYSWGYGVYAIIPDVDPANIQSDGSFVLNIQEINNRIESEEARLYYVVASGTNREGTTAAEKAYLETLAVAEEMTEIIKNGLCGGDLGEDDLYILGDILKGHAQDHAIAALKHPESLNMAIEFTQSLILLGNNNQNKELKLRPIALVVRATGDTWTPAGVYYGG